jgi:hypothetical protein
MSSLRGPRVSGYGNSSPDTRKKALVCTRAQVTQRCPPCLWLDGYQLFKTADAAREYIPGAARNRWQTVVSVQVPKLEVLQLATDRTHQLPAAERQEHLACMWAPTGSPSTFVQEALAAGCTLTKTCGKRARLYSAFQSSPSGLAALQKPKWSMMTLVSGKSSQRAVMSSMWFSRPLKVICPTGAPSSPALYSPAVRNALVFIVIGHAHGQLSPMHEHGQL